MTIIMDDPNRAEIDAAINEMPFASEFDQFDREEAIYWYAAEWHGGQGSNLYAVLSASEFKPSRMARGPSDTAQIIFDGLEKAFGV